jgi:hypothetical protein
MKSGAAPRERQTTACALNVFSGQRRGGKLRTGILAVSGWNRALDPAEIESPLTCLLRDWHAVCTNFRHERGSSHRNSAEWVHPERPDGGWQGSTIAGREG